MGLLDKRGLSEVVSAMLYSNVGHPTFLSYLLNFALLFYKFGVIVDYKLLSLDLINQNAYDKKYKGTLLEREGFFLQILRIANVVETLQNSRAAFLFFVLAILVGWVVLLALTLLRYSLFKRINFGAHDHRPVVPYYFKAILITIYNYDYFFIVILNMFIQTIMCVKYAVEEVENDTNAGLIKLQSERLDKDKLVQKYTSSSGISQDVPCLSVSHFFIGFAVSFAFICNVWIKCISHIVQTHKPNIYCVNSVYGHMQIFHYSIFLLMILAKLYLFKITTPLPGHIDTYYIFCTAILLIDFMVHTYFKPYYNRTMNAIRSVESLGMATFCVFILLVRDGRWDFVTSKYKLFIWGCLAFIVVLKLSWNFERKSNNVENITKRKIHTNREICGLAYSAFEYIDKSFSLGPASINDKSQSKIMSFFLALKQSRASSIGLKAILLVKKKMGLLSKNSNSRITKEQQFLRIQTTFADIMPTPSRDRNSTPMSLEKHSSETNAFLNRGLPTIYRKSLFTPAFTHRKALINAAAVLNHADSIEPSHKLTTQPHRVESIMEGVAGENDFIEVQEEIGSVEKDDLPPRAEEVLAAEKHPQRYLDESINYVTKGFKEINENSVYDILMVLKDIVQDKLDYLIRRGIVQVDVIFSMLRLCVYLNYYYLGNITYAMMKIHFVKELLLRGNKKLRIKDKLKENDSGGHSSFGQTIKGQHARLSIDKQLEAMKKSSKSEDKEFFSVMVLKDIISLCLKENLATGALVLNDVRSSLNSQVTDKEDNRIKLYDCFNFLNRYQKCKEDIQNAMALKLAFIGSAADTGKINFEHAYKSSKQLYIISEKIKKELKRLDAMVEGKFTPLKIVLGNFELHVLQVIKKGRYCIERAIKQRFNANWNILDPDEHRNKLLMDERVVIGVSGEKETFHRVNLVSCNAWTYLKYSPQSLQDEDLSIIIPEPIRSRHKEMLSPKFSTCSLLESKKPLPMVAIDSRGLAVLCKLTVRINYYLGKGLQFIGGMDFITGDNDDCLILVDEGLKISRVNNRSNKYFEAGLPIYKYNKNFKKIFKEMNQVAQYKLRNSADMNIDSMLHDHNLFKCCKTYYHMMTGAELAIIDKRKERRVIQCVVNDIYVDRIQEFIRCMHFRAAKLVKDSSGKSYNNLKRKMMNEDPSSNDSSNTVGWDAASSSVFHSEADQEALRMASKVHFEVRDAKINDLLNAMEEKLNIAETLAEGIPQMLGFDTFRFLQPEGQSEFLEAKNSSRTKVDSSSIFATPGNKSSGRLALSKYIPGGGLLPIVLENIVLRHKKICQKYFFKNLKNFKIDKHKSMVKKRISQLANYFKKIKHKHHSITVEEKKTERKSVESISRLFEIKLKYNLVNLKSIALCIIILVSFILQYFFDIMKLRVEEKVYAEVQYRLINADYNSWVIWSCSNLIQIADVSRMVHNGDLPNDNYKDWVVKPDLLTANYNLKSSMSSYLYVMTLIYSANMQNVTFPYEMFIDTKLYEGSETVAIKKPRSTDYFAYQEALAYIQPMVERFISWKDTVPPDQMMIGEPQYIPPEEDFLRRTLVNPILERVLAHSKSMYSYFRKTTLTAAYFSTYGYLVEVFVALITASTILIFLCMIRTQMSEFYCQLFKFRHSDVRQAANRLEIFKTVFDQVLVDEQIGYFNKGKLDRKVSMQTADIGSTEDGTLTGNKQDKIIFVNTGYSFGLYREFLYFLGLIVCLLLANFSQTLYRSNTSMIVHNLVDTYLHIIDTWNTHSILQGSLISMLLHNDSSTYLGQKPSETYLDYAQKFKQTIIPKYEALAAEDLGTYSEDFQTFFGDYSLCEGLKNYNKRVFVNCGQGPSSFVASNIVIFLKSLVSITDEVYNQYVMSKFRNQPYIKEILQNPKFKVYMAYTLHSVIMSDLYYMAIIPLGKDIADYVQWSTLQDSSTPQSVSSGSISISDKHPRTIYNILFIPIFSTVYVLSICLFVVPVGRRIKYYWMTIRLLPLTLVEKNAVMMYLIKRILAGSKRYVEF